MSKTLLAQVRAALAEAAEPGRAASMQAYMKSALPFHGVPAPAVRRRCRELFRDLAFPDAAAWERAVRALWTGATHREERYAAIILAGHRGARAFQTPDALPLYAFLICDGAWWDVVDDVAVHRVGPLLDTHPREVAPVLRAWSRSDDLWLRRAAIIAQVGRKDATDRRLLVACIAPALGAKEFFLRKAVGWALRALAWHDPDWVVAYVQDHEAKLSPLSKREALKNVRPSVSRPRRSARRAPLPKAR